MCFPDTKLNMQWTQLSERQKLEICQYKSTHPVASTTDISVHFENVWSLRISPSLIGKILRARDELYTMSRTDFDTIDSNAFDNMMQQTTSVTANCERLISADDTRLHLIMKYIEEQSGKIVDGPLKEEFGIYDHEDYAVKNKSMNNTVSKPASELTSSEPGGELVPEHRYFMRLNDQFVECAISLDANISDRQTEDITEEHADVSLQNEDVNLQNEAITHAVSEVTHQDDDVKYVILQAENITHKNEDATHPLEGVTHLDRYVILQAENITDQEEYIIHKDHVIHDVEEITHLREGATLKTEDITKQDAEIIYQYEDVTHQDKDIAYQVNNTAHQCVDPTHKCEDAAQAEDIVQIKEYFTCQFGGNKLGALDISGYDVIDQVRKITDHDDRQRKTIQPAYIEESGRHHHVEDNSVRLDLKLGIPNEVNHSAVTHAVQTENLPNESEMKKISESLPVVIIQCSQCTCKFSTLNELKEHEIKHVDPSKRKNMCDVCGKFFQYDSHLKIHKRFHTGEKPFKCDECGKYFACAADVRNHRTIHSDTKQFICDKCGKEFAQNNGLRAHMMTHTTDRTYGCSICNKRFYRADVLYNHVSTHSDAKPYLCTICDKLFRTKQLLKTHVKTHIPIAERNKSSEPTIFHCELCNKSYNRPSSLMKHIRRTHKGGVMVTAVDEKLKPHACSECGKRFKKKSDVTMHTRIHTGERPHGCDVCGKSFTHVTQLKQHMYHHHSDNKTNSICPICNKILARSYVTTHMKIHKND